MATSLPTEEEVLGYIKRLSNWGRWGSDDQLGTLNLITPEKRRQAAALVRDGVTVPCAWPIVAAAAADVTSQPMHLMLSSGESAHNQGPTPPGSLQGVSDFFGLVFHGHTITHVDALSHIFYNGKMYNGKPANLITTAQGATYHSIEAVAGGIVSRGVLLDIARLRGVDWLERGESILPDEMEAAEAAQGVRVEEGDVLLVRTGHLPRRDREGPKPLAMGRPGLHAACLPWLRERGVAMLGADMANDVSPSGYEALQQPIHQIGIPAMGLWLLDNCNLEALSQACAERRRWEFMIAMAPLRIRYGTGSPVTPIAIF
ncbi:MAG: cyclase family protein [Chloroflexi bacterium]|nr:cyclase family protein [Chloroflexota bacterium]